MPQFQYSHPVLFLGQIASEDPMSISSYVNELFAQENRVAVGAAPGAGDYTIQIIAHGYVAQRQTVTIEPGQIAEVTFLLKRGFVIEGIVSEDDTGEPLSDAVVRYVGRGTDTDEAGQSTVQFSAVEGQVSTDDDGRFFIAGLPEGTYTCVVRHRHFYFDGPAPEVQLPRPAASRAA